MKPRDDILYSSISLQASLKVYSEISIMTTIVQDIQMVRSLRKDIREVKLPANILNSIETIHNCIKSGTDLNGWKKVDWRGSGAGGGGSSNSGGNNYRNSGPPSRQGPGQGYNRGNDRGNGNSFFGGRQESTSGPSHYAFGNRSKGGFAGRQTEQPVSIPLTSGTSPAATPSPSPAPQNTVSADGFRMPPQKYVSKFKKSSDKVEDTILNTIILGKLNKFSEQNYDEIKEFITHIIDSGQTDMIKCFMKLVFEKAASEEMFCPLYAKLLSELSSRYPVLLTEMANLYSVYMAIFEEVQENSAENYNEVCKRNVEKKYRRGYSQFLAELIKHDVINAEIFIKTVNTIIAQIESNMTKKESMKLVEEYADCLNRIMRAIREDAVSDSDSDDSDEEAEKKVVAIRETLKGEFIKRIEPLTVRQTESVGLSNKARFTFLDIYEGIQKF